MASTRSPVLQPGEYNVYDGRGRLFTTSNDKKYALRLAAAFGGRVTIDLFGETVTVTD